MIVDCFTFYNGLDVLEIRLNSLEPYVDRFVICESPYDMVGKKKPLHFKNNKDRFSKFNITHLVVHDHLDHMGGWTPYYYQIDYMMQALGGEDMVMLSDFDEIPNLSDYMLQEGIFLQELYYYYLNMYTGKAAWKGTVAIKKKNIKKLSDVRQFRKKYNPIGTGWHFSYMNTPEEIVEKIEAFCHRELDTPDIKMKIAENKKNLVDPYNRKRHKLTQKMPSGPSWLIENKERYPHLWINGQRDSLS